MRKVKVCHMTSVHFQEDMRIFHKECVSLAENGYEVYLVERGDSYDKNGVHIIGVGEISNNRIKRLTEGARKVYKKALSLNCDIYHIHDPELLPYALRMKRQGKTVVFDSHELTREQILHKNYLPSFAALLISKLYATYEDYILEKIDGVIFPCPINGRFPLKGKRKVFLNNVPRLSELYYHYDPDSKKQKNSVCTIGSLSKNRGIKEMILAVHRAGCKAILGGTIRPKEFENELLNMPEIECAVFLGQIGREQVIQVYNSSMIGISSILNVGQYNMAENLPTKVYECMAMGLPVILTKNTYNEKMVKKYNFGICVDPQNIEEFSAAIRELADNPTKAYLLGQNGRSAVLEEFNWEHEQDNLFQLYGRLVDEKVSR